MKILTSPWIQWCWDLHVAYDFLKLIGRDIEDWTGTLMKQFYLCELCNCFYGLFCIQRVAPNTNNIQLNNQASDCIEFLYSDFSGQIRFFQQLGQESPLTYWCRKSFKTHSSLASLRLHRTGSFDKQHLKQTWRFQNIPIFTVNVTKEA